MITILHHKYKKKKEFLTNKIWCKLKKNLQVYKFRVELRFKQLSIIFYSPSSQRIINLKHREQKKKNKKRQLLRAMIKQNFCMKSRKKEAIQDKLAASLGAISFHRDSPRWPKGKWRDVH